MNAMDQAEQAGDLPAAIAMGKRAVAAYPDMPAPLFLLCRALLLARDPLATTLLPKLERFERFAPGWEALGTALLTLGRIDAAHAAFNRAINHAPERRRPYLGRAAAFEAQSRHADAAAMIEKAEALGPLSWELPYRRGLMLRAAGEFVAAREAFTRATELPQAEAKAWYALGMTCQDLDDPAAAVSAYRMALARKPDFHEATLNLGAALQEAGDFDAALDAYAMAYRLEPDSFGRIAQAISSSRAGRLFLDPEDLRRCLSGRA